MKNDENRALKIVIASFFGVIPLFALIFLGVNFLEKPQEKEAYNPSLGANILEILKKETHVADDKELTKIVSFSYKKEDGVVLLTGKSETYLYIANLTIDKNLRNDQLVKYFVEKQYENNKYSTTSESKHKIINNSLSFGVEYTPSSEEDTQRYFAGTFKYENYYYSCITPLGDDEFNIESISKKDVYKIPTDDSSMLTGLFDTIINN